MRRWAGLLRTIGEVETLDYPYMLEHRKRPDPLPRLIAAHRAALERVRALHRGPVVLIGKSMGSRIGCHVALEEKVRAVVCLGYPLCGAGDRSKLRDQVLRELATPILFVQGTRDALCPLDVLAEVRTGMQAPNRLEVVEGGDHSLAVTQRQLKASAETQDGVELRLLRTIEIFCGDGHDSA
jgi:predicted alpha/beta-hydrolase family hydrolase